MYLHCRVSGFPLTLNLCFLKVLQISSDTAMSDRDDMSSFGFESREDDWDQPRRSSLQPRRLRRDGSARSSSRASSTKSAVSTESGLDATATPAARQSPRGRAILPVSKAIADSRSSSVSVGDEGTPLSRGYSRTQTNKTMAVLNLEDEETTYEEMFGQIERQQLEEQGSADSTSLGLASEKSSSLATLDLGQSQSLAISEGLFGGQVARQPTAKPPKPESPSGGRKHSLQPFRAYSPQHIVGQGSSSRLSMFDDLLESRRLSGGARVDGGTSFASVGSSMRADIERAFISERPTRGNGPHYIGGRYHARNRLIYFGTDHLYESVDSIHSLSRDRPPRERGRKMDIPQTPHVYPMPEIWFTMADLARLRWKGRATGYPPIRPFPTAHAFLEKLGITRETTYDDVVVLPPRVFNEMLWKRPLHKHHQHRFYMRNRHHDSQWQDLSVEPPPNSPTPRRSLHIVEVGPPIGKGSLIYLPIAAESMLEEERLEYFVTEEHLRRFESACVASIELIRRQEKAARRAIAASMAKFVSLYIDVLLHGIEASETQGRAALERSIVHFDDRVLQIVYNEGMTRFVLLCEEEEYRLGCERLDAVGRQRMRRANGRLVGGGAAEDADCEAMWEHRSKYEIYLQHAQERCHSFQHVVAGYDESNTSKHEADTPVTPSRPVRLCPPPPAPTSPARLVKSCADGDVTMGVVMGSVVGEALHEGEIESDALPQEQETSGVVLVPRADLFQSRIRPRPPRQPRRPVSTSSHHRHRDHSGPIATTVNQFITNQWALRSVQGGPPSPRPSPALLQPAIVSRDCTSPLMGAALAPHRPRIIGSAAIKVPSGPHGRPSTPPSVADLTQKLVRFDTDVFTGTALTLDYA